MDTEQGGVKVENIEKKEDYIKNLKKLGRKRLTWTPTQLAIFILTIDPDYYLATPIDIKKQFKLKITLEKIERLMKSKEYNEVILRWFLEYAKSDERTQEQFYLLKEKYFWQQMNGMVSHKAMEIFGGMSGKYTSKVNTQVNTFVLSDVQRKQLGKSVAEALRNRQNRIKGGDGNGN